MPATLTRPPTAADVHARILAGTAPDDVEVEGTLEFKAVRRLRLPARLKVRRLRLIDCTDLASVPHGLRVRHLELRNCPRLATLPAGLHCYEVVAPESALVRLPDDLRVEFRLDLRDSRQLVRLPAGLTVGSLVLRGCTALEELPEGLDVCFLDLQGCRKLRHWPRRFTVRHGNLNLGGTGFSTLPPAVRRVA